MLPDSSFFIQSTTTSITHQRINAMSLQQVDFLEQLKEQQLAESVKRNQERRELVRLYKEAINKGYKLDPKNPMEQQMGDRVYKKIVADKVN